MTLLNGGNVGIGTNNPTAKLHIVQGNSGGVAAILLSTDESTIQGPSANTQIRMGSNLVLSASNVIPINTNGSERVRITSDGNVGIGTTSPSTTFHVYGNAEVGDSTADTGLIVRHGSGSSQYGRIRFYSASTNINTIHSFPTAWNSGTLINSSAGAINLTGTNGITFGAWNSVDVAFASGGTNYFKGNVGIGISTPSAILNIRASAPTSTGTVTTGTNLLIDSNTSNYITFRNTADNGTYAGLTFLDNNTGGYIVFRNYTGDVAGGSDSMIYGTYQDHIFQNGSSETINGKTETMRIKANGVVGIGTASPANSKLHIYADHVSGHSVLKIQTITSIAGGGVPSLAFFDSDGSRNTLVYAASDGTYLANEVAKPIIFSTNSTEKMRITSGGSVGIGTTSPADQLYVLKASGDSSATFKAASGGAEINLDATNGYAAVKLYSSGTEKWRIGQINDSNGFQIWQSGTGARIYVNSSGNVGIGTTSPTNGTLQVYNASGNTMSLQKAAGAAALAMGSETTNFALIESIVNGGMRFYTGNGTQTEKVRIDAGGNVGVGITSLIHKIQAAGLISAGDATYNNDSTFIGAILNNDATNPGLDLRRWNGGAAGTNNHGATYIATNSTGDTLFYNGLIAANTRATSEKMRISVGGNVGIGTSSPSSKLHVWTGTVQVSGFQSIAGGPLTFLRSDYNGSAAVQINFLNINPSNGFDSDLGIQLMNTGGSMVDVLRIKGSTGNVGIGTTSPSVKLTVSGDVTDSDVGQFRAVGSTSAAKMINVGYHTTNNYGFISALIAGTGYSTLSLQPNGGNVGIGTSSPGVKLDVVGGVRSFSSSGNYGLITNGSFQAVGDHGGTYMLDLDNTGAADLVNIKKSGTSRFYITNGGNVGVGTTSPAAKLAVSGNLFLLGINAQRQYTYFAIGSASDDIWLRSSSSFANNGASASINLSRLTYQSAGSGNDLTDKVGIWLRGFYDNSGGGLPIYLGGYAYSSQIPAVTITGLNSDGSGGNLGIGTTSPTQKLHVLTTGGSTTAPNIVATFQANTATTILAGGGTAIKFVGVSSGGNLQDYDQGMISTLGYADNNRHGMQFWVKPNASTVLTVGQTIDSNGNVGIGTTSPGCKFAVIGETQISSSSAYTTHLNYNDAGTNFITTANTGYTYFRGSSNNVTTMAVYGGGGVSVGTGSLESGCILTVSASNSARMSVTDGTTRAHFWPTGGAFYISTETNSPMVFVTNAGERMRILANGNVGIGTSSPTQKLEVNGTIKATSFVGSFSKTSTTQTITGNSALTIDVSAAYIHIITVAASGGVFGISSVTYNNRKAGPEVDEIILIFKWPASGSGVITISNTIGDIPFNYGKATVSRLTSYKGTTGLWIAETVASNIDYTNL
jgi:hypothetical protein